MPALHRPVETARVRGDFTASGLRAGRSFLKPRRESRTLGVGGGVRSADGLDLESAEPDLGVFDLESDLAAG